ncbi:DEAD/DEAH box helicase [Streptomyces sp. NPDC127172]|uniref:DEAD/DEAH box helicase n=1 Tax=Streptomyces sp. NPDC127172 TaxID=3345382 RepID=UPI00363DDA3F
MATIYRVVSVDEDGTERDERYLDTVGHEIPAPAAYARHASVPAVSVESGPAIARAGVSASAPAAAEAETTAGPPVDATRWATMRACTAVFLPGDPARQGQMAFHAVGSGPLPRGVPVADMEIVVAHGRGARRRTVPAVVRPLAEVLPWLLSGDGTRSSTVEAWRHAALYALHMAGRGLLLPGVSVQGHDSWRLGPYAEQDARWVRELAGAMAPAGYAVVVEREPGAGVGPVLIPDPYERVRAFMDAVADCLPRTPAAEVAAGIRPFAARERLHVPELRAWAARVADGRDTGVRLSLRIELPDGGPAAYEGEAYGAKADGEESYTVDGPEDWSGEDAFAQGWPHVESAGEAVRAVAQVHALSDPLLLADAAEVFAEGPDGFGPRAGEQVRELLGRAGQAWPPLVRLARQTAPAELNLDDDEFMSLLESGVEALAAVGIGVHLPRDLARELTAHAVIEPAEAPEREEAPAFFSPEQLLSFRWQFAVGDRTLTQDELDRLAQARRPLVRLRDQWVVVDADLLRKARRAPREVGALEALGAALTGSVEGPEGALVPVRPSGWLADLRDRIAAPEHAQGAGRAAPAALRATLRGYQSRGLAWLEQMTNLGLGACLADDMGLGKTITTLALHLRRHEDAQAGVAAPAGPTLVVCPASLLGNWGREIDTFAPGTPWRRHHGPGRDLTGLKHDEIVLTTYGTMRRDREVLSAAGPWGIVVADEAQHVKNPAGATAKALRTLPGQARVALSGTPVENNLTELWALLDWCTPGLLGPLKTFRDRYARAAERAARGSEGDDADAAAAERLGRLIRPFVLRRRKSDPGIAPELPHKTETDQRVLLSREQTVLYEAQVRESLAAIRRTKGIARHGLVLKLLTALKQICNHPAQYLKEPDTARLTGRSGKLELLDELLDVILAEDDSALLFTQYTQMARLLERHLTTRGVNCLYLHGRTPVNRREEMVAAFQRGEAPVFLLSLKAAGTGLNLTRAGHVIHYDRWWNPAVEDQATDRAHRIGQTRPIQVHRLVTESTVEDRIAQLLANKRGLADAVLHGQGEAALTDLDDDELADLVSLHTAAHDGSTR